MTHDERSLAAAYALGALDPDERRTFEAHLASCAECQDEVQSFGPATQALGRAVPTHEPRPELRQRVLAAAAMPPAARHPLPLDPRRARWLQPATWLPIAALLVVAAGLGVYAMRMHRTLSEMESRLDVAEQRVQAAARQLADAQRIAADDRAAMNVLAAPDLARIDLSGQSTEQAASARALWSRERGMVFSVANLEQAPAGRVYQVWVVTADGPVSAGLLMTGDRSGITYFATPRDIPQPIAVAVTVEPDGGRPTPTTTPILVGKV